MKEREKRGPLREKGCEEMTDALLCFLELCILYGWLFLAVFPP